MFDEARLERLTAAWFDKTLTPGETRELEAMLLSSARARDLFIERAEEHGLLREWAIRQTSGMLQDVPGPRASRRRRNVVRWFQAAGIAACLAVSAWLIFGRGERINETIAPGPEAPRDEVALLAQAIGVEWDGPAYAAGTALPKGRLAIRQGTLRLDFYSGARVFLEGPATLELLTQNLARLEHGRLTANVPPPAHGFTVLNNKLRVVDRGTEFGMNVNSADDCEVHVFDGEVELQGAVPASAGGSLFEGHAVSIRQGKAVSLTADRLAFANPAHMQQAAARETEASRTSWLATSEALRKSSDLRVYFDFEGIESGGLFVPNRAAGTPGDADGTVIGCDPVPGRWPQKAALGFARTSDRVRFRMEGTTPSLTLMASVRVDSLPHDHNALLSMSPDTVGEIHWKLDRHGRLLLGIRAAEERAYASWERLESPPIVTEPGFGRWMHLATVIDGPRGMMRHYLNGHEIAAAPLTRRPLIQLGSANLGNFDAAVPSGEEPGSSRSFNGRIDEFALFTRALSAEEIAAARPGEKEPRRR